MMLRVPVFRSTARSAMMMRPFSGNAEPSARDQLQFGGAALQLALVSHALVYQVVALADADEDAHRIDIGDGGEQGRLALPHEVAGRHQTRAGDAGDRRRDRAVLDVQFGLTDARLRGLHRGLRLLNRRRLVHLGGIQRRLSSFDVGPRALLGGQRVVIVLLGDGRCSASGFSRLTS